MGFDPRQRKADELTTDVGVMQALDAITARGRSLFAQRTGASIHEIAQELRITVGQRNYEQHQLVTLLAYSLAELAHKQHHKDLA